MLWQHRLASLCRCAKDGHEYMIEKYSEVDSSNGEGSRTRQHGRRTLLTPAMFMCWRLTANRDSSTFMRCSTHSTTHAIPTTCGLGSIDLFAQSVSCSPRYATCTYLYREMVLINPFLNTTCVHLEPTRFAIYITQVPNVSISLLR